MSLPSQLDKMATNITNHKVYTHEITEMYVEYNPREHVVPRSALTKSHPAIAIEAQPSAIPILNPKIQLPHLVELNKPSLTVPPSRRPGTRQIQIPPHYQLLPPITTALRCNALKRMVEWCIIRPTTGSRRSSHIR
jgi:hypothetical protein